MLKQRSDGAGSTELENAVNDNEAESAIHSRSSTDVRMPFDKDDIKLEKIDEKYLMLDYNGYVSETNATKVFIIKKGVISTPKPDYCLPGITRGFVIRLCKELGYGMQIRNISMSEVYSCDEMFTTGTMGELTPVFKVDGREIDHKVGEITKHLQVKFRKMTETLGEKIPSNV